MRRMFKIDEPKPPFAEFPIQIDLADWLGSESISSVTYEAEDLTTGLDAGTAVLDSAKNANGTSVVSPWLRGGTPGNTYKVKIKVTTDASDAVKDIFGFTVKIDNV